MLYIVSVSPKAKFRAEHGTKVVVVDAPTRVDALKASGMVAEGRRSQYAAPKASLLTLGKVEFF